MPASVPKLRLETTTSPSTNKRPGTPEAGVENRRKNPPLLVSSAAGYSAVHEAVRACGRKSKRAGGMLCRPCTAAFDTVPGEANSRTLRERTHRRPPSCSALCENRSKMYQSNNTSSDLAAEPSHQDERTGTRSNRATDPERTA
ncbi:hypothetical protein HPP92_008882 [Vanilla planifolia]|uniref:Uncharacterized protein n=1 Tax=Vanilla planifolia TaxID=51239 RepID=A0A835V635_VANPL|nr:hypothetical protein HPP92_008882 [Vanilla planifolia]